MSVALSIAGAAFTAFCIWLTVRIANRRERWAKWTAVGLVVVLIPTCGYVTAYFCMVTPQKPGAAGGSGPWPKWPDYTGPIGDRDQDFWENVFAPVHWIDTRLRPDVWFF